MEIEDNKVSKFHTVIQKCIVRVNLLIDYEEKALFKKKKNLVNLLVLVGWVLSMNITSGCGQQIAGVTCTAQEPEVQGNQG